ncbi:MAG: hypothetical protein ISN28_11280 [Ectothiorhodospiraceae bacterium AqS1]|nr:hypothetical protein [Ectothiorhodospiraceae bacterium AqS1]
MITATLSDTSKVTVAPTSITLNSSNYSTALGGRNFVFSGVEDNDQADHSVSATLSGTGLTSKTLTFSVQDDDPAIDAGSGTINLTEGGSAGSFDVKLTKNPDQDTAISVTSSDTSSVTVSPASLTFTTSNYSTAQSVTLTPVEDTDGTNETVTITLSATSGHTPLPPNVTRSVEVSDNDRQIGSIAPAHSCSAPSSGMINNTCQHDVSIKRNRTISGNCIASSNTLGNGTNVGVGSDNPQRICIQYEDAATQYSSGYAACNLPPVTDTDACGAAGSGTNVVTPAGLPVASISLSDGTVGEGNTLTRTVALIFTDSQATIASDVVVDLASSDRDVTLSKTSLTFTNANKADSQTFVVTAGEDSDPEDETVTITATPRSSSGAYAPTKTATVTVTDNDQRGAIQAAEDCVSFSGTNNVGRWGNGCQHALTLKTIETQSGRCLSTSDIPLGISNSSQVSSSSAPKKICFQYADAATQYSSAYAACNLDTNDGCGASGVSLGNPAPLPLVTISVSGGTVEEGSALSRTIILSLADSQANFASDFVVDLTSDNSEMTFSPASLTFTNANKGAAQTFTINAGQDSDQDDETVTVTATPKNTSGGYATATTATVTVTDDDTQKIEAGQAAISLTEGRSATFSVSLSGNAPTGNVVVSVTSDDTGAVTVSPASLTFQPSDYETGQNVTVTSADDTDGTNESVTITLSTTSGYDDAEDVTKTVTVTDDDGSIVVGSGTIRLTEGGSNATFPVTLRAAPKTSATISVTSADTDAVTVSPATLTFTSSNFTSAQMVTVSPVTDAGVLDESVLITLSAATGYQASDVTRRVEVDDNEASPFDGAIEIDPEIITVEEGDTVDVEITLSKAPTQDITLEAVNQSGSVFDDLTLSRTAITTSNWNSAITLGIEAAEDTNYTDDTGTIVLNIKYDEQEGGNTRTETLVSRTLSVAIEDNDTLPTGSIDISDADDALSLTEGGGTGTFTVSLGGTAPTYDVILSVTSNDTGAVTVSPATLTFTASNSTTAQTVTVTPVSDDDSADESVTVALAVTNGNLGAAEAIKTVRVTDDEESSVDFDSEGPITIGEGDSTTIGVRLGGEAPTQDVSVAITKTNADITIDTDLDTAGDQNTLTFTPRNSTRLQYITVNAAQDSDDTNDTDTITFTASGGIAATSTRSITVVDDDTPRIVVRPAGTLVIDEGRTHEFTVNLAGNLPTSNATVALTNTNSDITFDTNPAVAGNQTALIFTPANSTVPQTVAVKSVVDSDSNDDTDTITFTASGGITATLTKAVELRERAFELTSTDALMIREGASRVFSFKLAAQPTSDVDVAVSSTNQDIIVSPLSFSFSPANWGSTRNVSVTIAEDDDPDDETGAVILTASGSGLTGRTAIKAIEVDDNDDIRFSAGSLVVDEEGEATFRVRLWRQPSGNVNLTFSNTNEDITVDVDSSVDGVQSILSFDTTNWNQRMTVTVTAAGDIDTIDDTDTITITSQDVAGATFPVRVNDTTFTVIKSPVGGIRLAESEGQTLYFSLDKPPTVDQVEVRLTNENEDITLNPRVLNFTSSNWQTVQSVRIFARDDNDTDDDSDTVRIAATGVFDRRFEVSVADGDRELEEITPAFILSPDEGMVVIEGQPSYLHVRLNGRPTSETVVDVQRTNPRLSVRPSQISFGAATWKDPVVVRVLAEPDNDTVSDSDTITLVANGFPDTEIAVEIVDETGRGWPIKSRALAFPPATVHDSATMRVRCNQDTPCKVHLDCKAQDGTPLAGEIPDSIPAGATVALSNERLAEIIGGSWAGRGRLGCDLRSLSEISAQIWTRSGDGVLVNNSAYLRSAPEGNGDRHRVDIESISAPGNAEKSNLRIRCISENGVRCHDIEVACYDDEGYRYDAKLGSLLAGSVLHMQSQTLATLIRYQWTDMSLACEMRANQPFTVQVLTRTGGGGALVNNSATGSP